MNSQRHFIKQLIGRTKSLPLLSVAISLDLRICLPFSSSATPTGTPIQTHRKKSLYTSFFCTLIHLFLRCHRLSRATETFSSMRNYNLVPDIPSWNRLLHHFNSAGLVDQVIILYSDMLACGVASNVVTRNIVVHSLCKVGKLEKALELLRENESDTVTYNTLIWGFCRIEFVEMGFGLLSDMLKKGVFIDTITCNILIKGFCDKGLLYNAELVMEMLSDKRRGVCKDVVGFNTLIDGYCKAVEMSGGFEMMGRMKREGLSPDIVTYNTLINGFGIMGDFDAANCIMDELLDSIKNIDVSYVGNKEKLDHDDGENKGLVVGDLGLEPNTITYTTLISKYVKWFQFEKALATYEEMTRLGFFHDTVTYNCLIYGLCKNGQFHEAKLLLDEMRRVGVDPNHMTYSIFIHHLYKNKAEKDTHLQLLPFGPQLMWLLLYSYCCESCRNRSLKIS